MVVPVEMRGGLVTGFISEGDEVEVAGKVKKDGLMRVKQAHNLTTRAVVRTKGISSKGIVIIWLVFLVIIAVFVALVIIGNQHTHPSGFGSLYSSTASPDELLHTCCSDHGRCTSQWAYDQYSKRLKSEVASAQLSHIWSGKFIDSCTHDAVQVSGKQATTTLSITAKILANQSLPPEQTSTYHVILVQGGSNGWKIDRLQQG